MFFPESSIIFLKLEPVVVLASILTRFRRFLNDFLFDFWILLMKLKYLHVSILLMCGAPPVTGSISFLWVCPGQAVHDLHGPVIGALQLLHLPSSQIPQLWDPVK